MYSRQNLDFTVVKKNPFLIFRLIQNSLCIMSSLVFDLTLSQIQQQKQDEKDFPITSYGGDFFLNKEF